ncbi:hypothetical protein GQ53DRAFT_708712, partial [Thozetella sp. PMI_491]
MAQVTPSKRCPERSETLTEQHWYHLPSAKNLNICSRCYYDHLKPTQFADGFELEYDQSGTGRVCDFSTPRMFAVLRQALEQNSFHVLEDYIRFRSQIPRCKGAGVQTSAEDGVDWVELTDPSLAGQFAACKACYEDYVVSAGFGPFFARNSTRQPSGTIWICDFGWSFIQRLAKLYSDWSQFLPHALHRAKLPKCASAADVDGSSLSWWKLRAPDLGSLWLCECCFYDTASMTCMDPHVYQLSPQPPDSTRQCFSQTSIPLRVAWDAALQKQDFNIFYTAAQTFVRSPPCNKDGIQNGVWYSLNPPCEEFDVCAACYAGIVEASGAGHLMAPKWTQPGQARACDFNPAQPRMRSYFVKLDFAIERDDPSIFTNFVRSISGVPLCPGGALVSDRRWYRHDMFSCCPSCWVEVVEGTRLESCFFSKNESYQAPLRCDFYSARVRGLWRSACEKNDLAGFTNFMQRRLEVWKQTYPQIQQHLAQMRMNMQTQQTLFMSSLLNTGGNNIAAAAGVHGNYGNNQIGYGYETYAGAQGAMQFNQALGMNGTNGSLAMNVTQLELLWKSVE